ncbi:UNVERIFIED_ORG: multisubunit Na+/H+ antiporter MnhG subunit [Comamonas terrigena]
MFAKTALTTSRTLYVLLVAFGLIWLAWVCLANMSLGMAAAVFVVAGLLMAAVLAPVAAALAGLVGVLVGAVAALLQLATRRDA